MKTAYRSGRRAFTTSSLSARHFDTSKFSNSIRLSSLIFLLGTAVHGEILDRIVAVIDDRFLITLSDVRKERTIQSAFGRDAGTDEAIVDALVERHLVEDQIAQYRRSEERRVGKSVDLGGRRITKKKTKLVTLRDHHTNK